MVQCTKDVPRWFIKNALLLKPWLFRSILRLQPGDVSNGINAVDQVVQFTETVKLLGVIIDTTLSFDDHHVTDVDRSCNCYLRAFRHITADNMQS